MRLVARCSYREGATLVLRAWGWDVATGAMIEPQEAGMGWTSWDVRLAKILRSLWLFQERDLLTSVQGYARAVKPDGGLRYGPHSLDEVYYMRVRDAADGDAAGAGAFPVPVVLGGSKCSVAASRKAVRAAVQSFCGSSTEKDSWQLQLAVTLEQPHWGSATTYACLVRPVVEGDELLLKDWALTGMGKASREKFGPYEWESPTLAADLAAAIAKSIAKQDLHVVATDAGGAVVGYRANPANP